LSYLLIIIFLNSNSYGENNRYFEFDKGIIALMYHRFDEHKYPSTNIQMDIFKEQINIIENLKINFLHPKNFNEEISKPNEVKKILLTIDDGTRFEKQVDVAAPSIQPTIEMISYFAVIGTYVGIIPVLIGLLWFPFISKLSRNKYKFFLALTVGFLLFLGISTAEEAIGISSENLSDVFNGVLLVATVSVVSFLALNFVGEKLIKRAGASKLAGPVAIALMIAIGIGLHNFGEGLAIGAAIVLGEAALGAFLIVGYALHNTTEGFAIAAPMARTKLMIGRLAAMGMIAGVPAIFGAWVGGFVYSPLSAVIFLAIGAGAIFQVIVTIMRWIQNEEGNLSNSSVLAGIAVGMIIMYVTSLLV